MEWLLHCFGNIGDCVPVESRKQFPASVRKQNLNNSSIEQFIGKVGEVGGYHVCIYADGMTIRLEIDALSWDFLDPLISCDWSTMYDRATFRLFQADEEVFQVEYDVPWLYEWAEWELKQPLFNDPKSDNDMFLSITEECKSGSRFNFWLERRAG